METCNCDFVCDRAMKWTTPFRTMRSRSWSSARRAHAQCGADSKRNVSPRTWISRAPWEPVGLHLNRNFFEEIIQIRCEEILQHRILSFMFHHAIFLPHCRTPFEADGKFASDEQSRNSRRLKSPLKWRISCSVPPISSSIPKDDV